MDFRLFLTTSFAVFLAEMGDKTQIATLSIASSTKARWLVFLAASLGLVAASAIAVLAGEVVGRYVSPTWIRRAAGAIFIVMGVLYLVGSGEAAG